MTLIMIVAGMCLGLAVAEWYALGCGTCKHTWRPHDFADWRCTKCGRFR
jgi:PHP family Zn ribbon phosphoesterase